MQHADSHRGFTLAEMLVVVSIIGIIAALATPNMLRQIQQMRINEGIAIIEAAFKEARAQALVSQQPTVARYIDNANGRIIILEALDNNRVATEFARYNLNDRLTINLSSKDLATLRFMPNKQVLLIDDSPVNNGSFSVCTGRGTDQYRLEIDQVGNITTARGGACL